MCQYRHPFDGLIVALRFITALTIFCISIQLNSIYIMNLRANQSLYEVHEQLIPSTALQQQRQFLFLML
jgi:hypothetical protein